MKNKIKFKHCLERYVRRSENDLWRDRGLDFLFVKKYQRMTFFLRTPAQNMKFRQRAGRGWRVTPAL